MDWKAEALAQVRRARKQANNLTSEISKVTHSLSNLQGYDAEQWSMADAIGRLTGIVTRLFKLEDELSRP